MNCPLSTVHCQLSTVNCQLSTVPCPLSIVHCYFAVAGVKTLTAGAGRGTRPLQAKLEFTIIVVGTGALDGPKQN